MRFSLPSLSLIGYSVYVKAVNFSRFILYSVILSFIEFHWVLSIILNNFWDYYHIIYKKKYSLLSFMPLINFYIPLVQCWLVVEILGILPLFLDSENTWSVSRFRKWMVSGIRYINFYHVKKESIKYYFLFFLLLFSFIFITHYKIYCMLHNTLHNLLTGVDEYNLVISHQSGKCFLNVLQTLQHIMMINSRDAPISFHQISPMQPFSPCSH